MQFDIADVVSQTKPILAEGNIEDWLSNLEKGMRLVNFKLNSFRNSNSIIPKVYNENGGSRRSFATLAIRSGRIHMEISSSGTELNSWLVYVKVSTLLFVGCFTRTSASLDV